MDTGSDGRRAVVLSGMGVREPPEAGISCALIIVFCPPPFGKAETKDMAAADRLWISGSFHPPPSFWAAVGYGVRDASDLFFKFGGWRVGFVHCVWNHGAGIE